MGDHFSEGDSGELPVHAVLLDSFFMSKFTITNRQYCDYLNSAVDGSEIKVIGGIVYDFDDVSNFWPYCDTHSTDAYSQIDYNDSSGTFSVRTKGETPRDMSDDPMVKVSWFGAMAYCNWRSQQEGREICYNLSTWNCDFNKKGYRLATEAEWEYAARGGEHSPYYRFPWGDTISHSQVNYNSSSSDSYDVSPTSGYHPIYNDGIFPYTAPVGSFSTNGYGLYNMTGNVWEWCNDWWSAAYYSSSPYDNPRGSTSGIFRILRGGSWGASGSEGRVAFRFCFGPLFRNGTIGFRVVLNLN
jgi:formylglycine-generating enzyme required for sulfatase activity